MGREGGGTDWKKVRGQRTHTKGPWTWRMVRGLITETRGGLGAGGQQRGEIGTSVIA